MIAWHVRGRPVGPATRPAVMGIINVTPDSFVDGGLLTAADRTAVLARAEELVAAGADVLDVGGESSRPGAAPVPLDEEIRRVVPAVECLAWGLGVPISVDTAKPAVARAAIAAGASIINDIGGLGDPAMLAAVAADGAGGGVGVVIMHMQGTPATMQDAPSYGDVVAEVAAFLADRVAAAGAAGIAPDRIAVDPGIGFGKTFDHNIVLLRHLDRLAAIGCPILVGTSRKGFLGRITGRPVADRAAGSVASALAAAACGASIVRVHDVAATVDALKVWEAQVGFGPAATRGW